MIIMSEKRPIETQNQKDIKILEEKIKKLEVNNTLLKNVFYYLTDYFRSNTRNKSKKALLDNIQSMLYIRL